MLSRITISATGLASCLLVSTSEAVLLSLDPTNNTTEVLGAPSSGIDYGGVQNTAVFTIEAGPGGTGNFGSFLGLRDSNDADTIEMGHNTGSGSQLQSEVQYGTNTDDVQLSTFGMVSLPSTLTDPEIDPGNYITFALDMNPKGSVTAPTIVYSELQVWISPTVITNQYPNGPSSSPFLGDDGASLVWDLNANGTSNQLSVQPSNNGSGSTDMLMYIPVTAFLEANPGSTSDYYVYVWANQETGGDTLKNDLGYVSGATDATYLTPGTPLSTVPEPRSFALLTALAAIAFVGFKRRR